MRPDQLKVGQHVKCASIEGRIDSIETKLGFTFVTIVVWRESGYDCYGAKVTTTNIEEIKLLSQIRSKK